LDYFCKFNDFSITITAVVYYSILKLSINIFNRDINHYNIETGHYSSIIVQYYTFSATFSAQNRIYALLILFVDAYDVYYSQVGSYNQDHRGECGNSAGGLHLTISYKQ